MVRKILNKQHIPGPLQKSIFYSNSRREEILTRNLLVVNENLKFLTTQKLDERLAYSSYNNIYCNGLILFLLIILFSSCNKGEEPDLIPVSTTTRMNGVSFTGPVDEIEDEALNPLLDINSNYIALMPFGFGEFGETELRYDLEWQWWGEKSEGIIQCTKYARERNLKVFLKPHLWFWYGSYTGDFELDSENDWQEWESNYLDYIMHNAVLADSLQIEMFAIGVELKKFIHQRPAFWNLLIDSVRTVYSGTLTYAANWDNYDDIPFWDKLDLIGIDAYFPLSEKQTPEITELTEKWDLHYNDIYDFSKAKNKKVIFTEYGYKSIDHTTQEPWNPNLDGSVNLTAQVNAYEALYQKFWNEEWFLGGFLWKWFDDHGMAGGHDNKNFTPQNKPVEDVIAEQYSKN